jgi:VanZ family protein
MNPRVALLTLAYAGIVAYASLYPFSWRAAGVDPFGLLNGKWAVFAPKADNLANVLAYLPLGLLVALCLTGVGSFALRVTAATAAGLALSLSMEFLQQYLPGRIPSRADLGTNACGALIGALGASFLDAKHYPGALLSRWRAHWIKPGRQFDLGLMAVAAWVLSQWLPGVPSFTFDKVRAGLASAWRTLHELASFDLVLWGRYALYITGLALLERTAANPGRPALSIFFLIVAGVLACKIVVIGRELSLEAIAGLVSAIGLTVLWLGLRLRTVVVIAGLFLLGGLICAHFVGGQASPQHLSHWAPFRGPIDHLVLGLGSVVEILWPPAALGYLARLAAPLEYRRAVAWSGAAAFAMLVLALDWQAHSIALVTVLFMAGTWALFGLLFLEPAPKDAVRPDTLTRQISSGAARALSAVTACGAFLIAIQANPTDAATIRVGPQSTYKVPSAAARVARDGDLIEIEAGLYAGDAAVWQQNRLTIRGMNGRAHMRADGAHAEGKAIWVIKGANTTVENIEFSGAKVADRNGAGIRLEGPGLTLRNCHFHHNEMGILTGAHPTSEVLIERSEFSHNARPDGHNHNVYIGAVRSFTLRASSVHHAMRGHNVKSRALQNFILYNRIMDERDGRSSYALEFPNGGVAFVIGNVIQQGPLNDNRTIVAFGTEGTKNPVNELHFVANTVVNEDPRGARFVFIKDRIQAAPIFNNVFAGPGDLLVGPGELSSNARVGMADFVAPEKSDYRLKRAGAALGAPTQ